MNTSTIQIEVTTDENRIPAAINWKASDAPDEKSQVARAMLLSIWDPADKAALRIDLWTKEMMVDEMADFFLSDFDDYGRHLWTCHPICRSGRRDEGIC